MEPTPKKPTESPKEQPLPMSASGEHESAVRLSQQPAPQRAPVKLRKFEAPKEIAEKFSVQSQSEEFITGFVKTEDVRELLDAFGLQDRVEITFPFQHMKRAHGELWAFRVEPPASHTVDGAPVMAHAWTYQQALPERVSSGQ